MIDTGKASAVAILRKPQWLWGMMIAVAVLTLAGCGGNAARVANGSDDPQAYDGTELTGQAPDFRLIDQHGTPTALSDLRGRAVVLAFMDTRCDETCPLTAMELWLTNQALGADSSRMAFVGVNVNARFNKLEDAVAMTNRFQLGEIPSWRFLTGPVEQLEQAWSGYSIEVGPSNHEEEDVSHTPGIYVIDQDGQLRWYLSTPLAQDGLVAPWEGPVLNEVLTDKLRELITERDS